MERETSRFTELREGEVKVEVEVEAEVEVGVVVEVEVALVLEVVVVVREMQMITTENDAVAVVAEPVHQLGHLVGPSLLLQ